MKTTFEPIEIRDYLIKQANQIETDRLLFQAQTPESPEEITTDNVVAKSYDLGKAHGYIMAKYEALNEMSKFFGIDITK